MGELPLDPPLNFGVLPHADLGRGENARPQVLVDRIDDQTQTGGVDGSGEIDSTLAVFVDTEHCDDRVRLLVLQGGHQGSIAPDDPPQDHIGVVAFRGDGGIHLLHDLGSHFGFGAHQALASRLVEERRLEGNRGDQDNLVLLDRKQAARSSATCQKQQCGGQSKNGKQVPLHCSTNLK